MNSNGDPTSPPAAIREKGWGWWAYSAYVVFALGLALVFVTIYLIITSPGLFDIDLPGALLGIAAFLMGLAILDRLPRHVELSPESIKFRYLLSHVTLRWDQLAAPTLAGKGFVSFRATTGTRGVWGPLTVTVPQARAILAYPACPSFDLPDDVANVLRSA